MVLQKESTTLGRFWGSGDWAEEAWIPEQREALGLLDPSHIRAVALTYPEATACTVDGMHPRHFSMLSTGGLLTLA